MAPTLSISHRYPKKDFSSITQLGLKALGLAQTHFAALSPRLPGGLLEMLEADIGSLSSVVHDARHAKLASIAITSAQYQVLAKAYTQVTQIRAAIRSAKATASTKKAYGVGTKVEPRCVRDVRVALTQILERAKEAPEEAASLGILQKDLTALADARAAVDDIDRAQEKARADAPQSTKERNQRANRILAAVGRIEGAGRMEYANDEALREPFEALGPSMKRRRKSAERTVVGQ